MDKKVIECPECGFRFHDSGFIKDGELYCDIEGCKSYADYEGYVYTFNPDEDPTIGGSMFHLARVCTSHKHFLIGDQKKKQDKNNKKPDKIKQK